jgi:hypothetical protein
MGVIYATREGSSKMGGGYYIAVDPSEMANRYSMAPSDDPWSESIEEADLEGAEVDLEEAASWIPRDDAATVLAPFLHRLPEREADLIEMYYLKHKRQADIAALFGVSQAAISYSIGRAIHRVKFLLSVPDLTVEDLRRDLPHVPFKPIDVEILVGMWETTCQSAVALKLDLTQGRVRHRFFAAVKVLEKASGQDVRFEPYQKFFSAIARKNWNALRSVQLPQWSGRGKDECS